MNRTLQVIQKAIGYIEGMQQELNTQDGGDILSELRAEVLEIKNAVVPVIPIGLEVIIHLGDDKFMGGRIDSVSHPDTGTYRLVLQDGSITEAPPEKLTFESPVKYGWDEVDDTDALYISQYSDGRAYSKANFIALMDGDEAAARRLFDACEWEDPKTLLDKHGKDFFIEAPLVPSMRP